MGTFDHIHIYATDVDASLRFYEEVLGAEPIGALGNRAGGLNHLLVLGGVYVAVSAFPASVTPRPPSPALEGALDVGFGIAHFGFNVDDLDEVLQRVRDAGCEVHGEPNQVGPLRYAYVTVPDGVVIELTQYVLPAKLRAAGVAMRSVNTAIHRVKRFIGRRMLAAAQSR